MDCEFSEFSYGFAVTTELADALQPLSAAPVLPSLIAEGTGGWDLRLENQTGAVVFAQFKIPFACTRGNALEWDTYGETYYRLYVRRLSHSDQHNRLKRLSRRQRLVYYLAPRFYELATFNQEYLGATVLAESVAFPLRVLPLLTDDQQHYICYRTGTDGLWCSDGPVEVEGEQHETLFRTFATELARRVDPFSRDRLAGIRDDLVGALTDEDEKETPAAHIESARRMVRRSGYDDISRDIVYLSRTYFNAETIFLTKPTS